MEELASVGLYAISRPDEPETMAPDLTLAIQGAWIRGNGGRAPGGSQHGITRASFV